MFVDGRCLCDVCMGGNGCHQEDRVDSDKSSRLTRALYLGSMFRPCYESDTEMYLDRPKVCLL